MDLPIILFDDGDISLFNSIEALSLYVESPDVERYMATDSSGHLIRLEPSTLAGRSRVGIVPVEPVTATLTTHVLEEAQFRRRLVEFLRRFTNDFDEGAPLGYLIRDIEKRVGFTS